MTLDALGWTALRQQDFAAHAADGLVPARVVSEHRSHYQVATDLAELTAELKGRTRKSAAVRSDLPGVGDFVALRLSHGDGPATIESVLPRTSALVRKAAGERTPQLLAANVDVVFIITAMSGDLNLQRLERYLALVQESGAAPVIVVNKADLAEDMNATTGEIAAIAPGVPVHAISARGGVGLAALDSYFEGKKTVVFVGSSGVGKSTLTNELLGRTVQATQDIRAHDGRGRHTTTHRQLILRPQGGVIIDTPGIRGLELWNPEPVFEAVSEEIEALALKCKFRNCKHETEPGCAVRAAAAQASKLAD